MTAFAQRRQGPPRRLQGGRTPGRDDRTARLSSNGLPSTLRRARAGTRRPGRPVAHGRQRRGRLRLARRHAPVAHAPSAPAPRRHRHARPRAVQTRPLSTGGARRARTRRRAGHGPDGQRQDLDRARGDSTARSAEGKRAWYTSPLKALTNSKFHEFSAEFGDGEGRHPDGRPQGALGRAAHRRHDRSLSKPTLRRAAARRAVAGRPRRLGRGALPRRRGARARLGGGHHPDAAARADASAFGHGRPRRRVRRLDSRGARTPLPRHPAAGRASRPAARRLPLSRRRTDAALRRARTLQQRDRALHADLEERAAGLAGSLPARRRQRRAGMPEMPPSILLAALGSYDLLPAIIFLPTRRRCDEAAAEAAYAPRRGVGPERSEATASRLWKSWPSSTRRCASTGTGTWSCAAAWPRTTRDICPRGNSPSRS